MPVRLGALALVATAVLAMATSAGAQPAYPIRPITLIVPFAAGESADMMARALAEKMGQDLGQQIVVENLDSPDGIAGATEAARADPDGYTLLIGTRGTHILNPTLHDDLPYDPVVDFAPISLLAIVPDVLVASPDFPARDLRSLITVLKAKPGAYASAGTGTPSQFAGELFRSVTGIELSHIPYQGIGPALVDVMDGYVPIMFAAISDATDPIKAGKLRGLAVATTERAAALPDLPTMTEAGLPGFESYDWDALFAPAGTPPRIVAKLNQAVVTALADPDVRTGLQDLGATMIGSTADVLDEQIKGDLAKWTLVVKASGAPIN